MATRKAAPRKPPAPLERDISRAITKALEAMGLVVIRIQSGVVKVGDHYVRQARKGTHDKLVLGKQGRSLFVEVKRPGEKLKPAQVRFAARLERLGHRWVRADNVRDVVAVAREWLL